MAGNPNVNPYAAPVQVPFQKTVTTSQRGVGQTSTQVNSSAWTQWTQNVGDTQVAVIAQVTLLNNAVASLQTVVGVSTLYAGFVAPGASWHVCDGSAISRTTFATLFAIIGTTFGAGDGSTTFNLPTCGAPGGATGLNFFMRVI